MMFGYVISTPSIDRGGADSNAQGPVVFFEAHIRGLLLAIKMMIRDRVLRYMT